MKTSLRIFFILLVASMTALPVWGRRMPGEKVGVAFDSLIFDFGTVSASSAPVSHDYVFEVSGKQPVSILYATPSCGCTASDFPRKPTKPGEKGVIKVTFEPKGQKGEVEKDVRVRFRNGADKSEQLTLRIRGVVVP